jgi:hypothetical protein
MAKRIEVIDGVFLITDTISSVIEVRTPATNIFHTEYSGRIFFFLQEEDERTLGYLWSDFVDSSNNPFGSLQDLLNYLDANIGEAALPGVNSTVLYYREDYELSDKYIYSGFVLDNVSVIARRKDSVYERALGVTNIGTDWANRLTFTYTVK